MQGHTAGGDTQPQGEHAAAPQPGTEKPSCVLVRQSTRDVDHAGEQLQLHVLGKLCLIKRHDASAGGGGALAAGPLLPRHSKARS